MTFLETNLYIRVIHFIGQKKFFLKLNTHTSLSCNFFVKTFFKQRIKNRICRPFLFCLFWLMFCCFYFLNVLKMHELTFYTFRIIPFYIIVIVYHLMKMFKVTFKKNNNFTLLVAHFSIRI